MILFIKNISIEGPETLGDFFAEKGFLSQTVDLSLGEKLPSSLNEIEAVVCLGGPMNVYEEDKYPFLKEEDLFIKKALKEKIPFLGICLGSQLLAKASGAKVTRAPVEEIGFSYVTLTEEGKEDPLFDGIKSPLWVYQWHGDTFGVPKKGSLLASSAGCPHQAIKIGENAHGLQFHVEITDKNIQEWAQNYFDQNELALKDKTQEIREDYARKKEIFNENAQSMYNNFLKIIQRKVPC